MSVLLERREHLHQIPMLTVILTIIILFEYDQNLKHINSAIVNGLCSYAWLWQLIILSYIIAISGTVDDIVTVDELFANWNCQQITADLLLYT